VALERVAGIARPALPSTVARNRACWAIRLRIPPAGLKAAGFTKRANIVYGISKVKAVVGMDYRKLFSLLKLSRCDLVVVC